MALPYLEIAPNLVRAAFVANPKTAPYYNYYLRAAEAITLSLAIDLVLSPVEVHYPRFQDRALRNPDFANANDKDEKWRIVAAADIEDEGVAA